MPQTDIYSQVLATHLQQISTLLYAFTMIGVVACSISGVIRAINAKMDITGAILLAFVTSNGGGTFRDLILGSQVFWIHDQIYIWLTFLIGAATYTLFYFKRKVLSNKRLFTILIVTDAFGLAAFSLAGVEKSIACGQNNGIAIIMGVWTAVGGGILADVISNRIPLVFSEELYITVAFLGSICYLTLYGQINNVLASMVAAVLMVVVRLYSVKYKWKFPTIL